MEQATAAMAQIIAEVSMGTKWDPLVLKYHRRNQQELGRLAELRRHLKETEANRDKVAERQQYAGSKFRQTLRKGQ